MSILTLYNILKIIYSYMYIHRRRDPINQLIKLKFIVIIINNLPFIFVHFLAFYCKNTFSSIACSSFKFGDNCASTCTCVQANSESCNNVDGKCSCKAGYTGSNCDNGKHIPLLTAQSIPSVLVLAMHNIQQYVQKLSGLTLLSDTAQFFVL